MERVLKALFYLPNMESRVVPLRNHFREPWLALGTKEDENDSFVPKIVQPKERKENLHGKVS